MKTKLKDFLNEIGSDAEIYVRPQSDIYKGDDLQEGDVVIYRRSSYKGTNYPDEEMEVTIDQISNSSDGWKVGWYGYNDKNKKIIGFETLKSFQKRIINK